MNESFRAVLRGDAETAAQHLDDTRIALRAGPEMASGESAAEFEERKAATLFMAELVEGLLAARVDGRSYKSALGEAYGPRDRPLTLAPFASVGVHM